MANPIIDNLRAQLRSGSALVKLIALNAIIFIAINLVAAVGQASGHNLEVATFLDRTFTLDASLNGLIHQPWGLITSIFAHFGFVHFLMNMLVLYFAGSMFLQHFTSRRLFHLYIIGGLAGGLFEILANVLLPQYFNVHVLGASGSIMAIFIAVAVYRPNTQVALFGIFPVRLILLAGLYVFLDLIRIGSNDHTAHIAHLGGALIGFLSIQKLHSKNNIINMSESFGQKWKLFWSNLFKPKTRLKVEKGGRPVKTDEQYNMEKKAKQEKTNAILDKISKSGYESLSKSEKEFLFSQSKNG